MRIGLFRRTLIYQYLKLAEPPVIAEDNLNRYHRNGGRKPRRAFFVIIKPNVIAKQILRLRLTEQGDNILLAHSRPQLPDGFFGQRRALTNLGFVGAAADNAKTAKPESGGKNK